MKLSFALITSLLIGVDAQRRRDLKGSKDPGTCDILQGLPIYDEFGGYIEYSDTFTSIDGEEKAMSYTNLAQEYIKYFLYLLNTEPGPFDPNVGQPYSNLHLVYGSTPSIVAPTKYIFAPSGPVTAYSVFLNVDSGDGDGDGDGNAGFQNFLAWHLGTRFFEILAEDPDLDLDSEALILADLYTDAALTNGEFLFYLDSKLDAKISKCKLDDELSKLVKGDPYDVSNERLEFQGIGGYFVLLPPGLPEDKYEINYKAELKNFYPPNTLVPADEEIKIKSKRVFCVGSKKYCKDKLGLDKRDLSEAKPVMPGKKRKLTSGNIGVDLVVLP